MKQFIFIVFIFPASVLLGQNQKHSLDDFFKHDPQMDSVVQSVYDRLSPEQRIGQLLMPAVGRHGKPTDHVMNLVRQGKVGGVLLLNGTKDGFTKMAMEFDRVAKENNVLPLLFSADAEPSLIRYKIKGSTTVKNANLHETDAEVKTTAATISKDLNEIGINYNFAPVVDQGTGNEAITNRSFGFHPDSIWKWSNTFIQTSQDMGVIATAKHFPGHGLVKGDTHDKLVFIDGLLKEVDNYTPVIAGGVLSIMVAHIAIKNNPQYGTKGMPATCSRTIVTDLLKEELGFKGLIITDAMNMGGVRNIPDCGRKAIEAGCDILLMPVNEEKDLQSILAKFKSDEAFRKQVEESVKKIIRAKVCLNLI